jgi:hypothetical protein
MIVVCVIVNRDIGGGDVVPFDSKYLLGCPISGRRLENFISIGNNP